MSKKKNNRMEKVVLNTIWNFGIKLIMIVF